MTEAVVDGIGNALYGALTFKDGRTEQSNFNNYRLIRHREDPTSIEVHFVENEIDPTCIVACFFALIREDRA